MPPTRAPPTIGAMKNALLVSVASAAGLALVLGGAGVANAATPTPAPSPSSSSSCSFAQHLVHGWFELPKSLRTDLRDAKKADSKADKAKDLKDIRTKAIDGGYGAVVKDRAEHLQSLDLRPLPDNLKADLKTLHGESTRADKVKEAGVIAQNALDGDYGDAIQSLAKQVQSSKRWQSCTPKAGSAS